MKDFWRGVLYLSLLAGMGYVEVAHAGRKPAVVSAMQAEKPPIAVPYVEPADMKRARTCDSERWEALSRVSRLRGALLKLRLTMESEQWPGTPGVPPGGSVYREVWDLADTALRNDDRIERGE